MVADSSVQERHVSNLKTFRFIFLCEFVVLPGLDNIIQSLFEPLRAPSGIDTNIDQKKYLFPRLGIG